MSQNPQQFRHYTILKELGRGGMGVVYLAKDTRLDRLVALKTLLPNITTLETIQRFELEASTMAKLRHPGLVKIYERGQSPDGIYYFAMEYLASGNLQHKIDGGQHSTLQVIRWLIDIASALTMAHEKGIIHRDLKPENILMRGEQPVVSDFGLVYQVNAAERFTQTGTIVGTPSFMAPEQIDSSFGLPSGATDIYAIGVIAQILVTGVRPFQAATIPELMRQILKGERVNIPAEKQCSSPELRKIINRCLERYPKDRFQSCRELLAALYAAQAQLSQPVIETKIKLTMAQGVAFALSLCLVILCFGIKHAISQKAAVNNRLRAEAEVLRDKLKIKQDLHKYWQRNQVTLSTIKSGRDLPSWNQWTHDQALRARLKQDFDFRKLSKVQLASPLGQAVIKQQIELAEQIFGFCGTSPATAPNVIPILDFAKQDLNWPDGCLHFERLFARCLRINAVFEIGNIGMIQLELDDLAAELKNFQSLSPATLTSSEASVVKLFKQAVDCELQFATSILSVDEPGINDTFMSASKTLIERALKNLSETESRPKLQMLSQHTALILMSLRRRHVIINSQSYYKAQNQLTDFLTEALNTVPLSDAKRQFLMALCCGQFSLDVSKRKSSEQLLRKAMPAAILTLLRQFNSLCFQALIDYGQTGSRVKLRLAITQLHHHFSQLQRFQKLNHYHLQVAEMTSMVLVTCNIVDRSLAVDLLTMTRAHFQGLGRIQQDPALPTKPSQELAVRLKVNCLLCEALSQINTDANLKQIFKAHLDRDFPTLLVDYVYVALFIQSRAFPQLAFAKAPSNFKDEVVMKLEEEDKLLQKKLLSAATTMNFVDPDFFSLCRYSEIRYQLESMRELLRTDNRPNQQQMKANTAANIQFVMEKLDIRINKSFKRLEDRGYRLNYLRELLQQRQNRR